MLHSKIRSWTSGRIAALFITAAPHIPKDEAAAAAHIISGAAEQLARWWHGNPQMPIESLVDGVMSVLWPGLQNRLDDAAA